jgi:LysR family transcriptional regulator, cyn operon transcriptional activator
MELRHLRYFMALAGSLNFTRAAERVHVTQSTLSHQIKQLEDELGVALFDRVGKRVTLTAAGEIWQHHVQRALAEIDQGLGALKQDTKTMSGQLRIGSTHTFNIDFIPDCIAVFQPRYPQVQLLVEELSAQSIMEGLQQGTLDMGIAYRPSTQENLLFEALYNEEMVLVVAKGHALARRKRVRMVELHRLPMVLLPTSYATRTLLDECFAACGASPLVVAEVNTPAPMLRMVAKANLACIVAPSAVALNADLHTIRLESPTPVRTPGMLWAPGRQHSSAARAFGGIVRKLALKSSLQSMTGPAG